jgi:ParB/RepB/Spo0J family partition protein
MAVRKVLIADVRPNPWQARLEEDAEHVKEVAGSIVALGLLQNPAGRERPDGKIELCYGMTRAAAYKWLAQHKAIGGQKYDPADYVLLPVDVRKLDNREMFEAAIAENEQRKDLSPIERATAIKRYMVEFKASREQAGALFGLQGTSVSNVVALLDLAPSIQAMVHSGEMAERTARLFVHLSRLNREKANNLGQTIRQSKERDPDRIASQLAEAMQTTGRLLVNAWDHRGQVEGKWWQMDEDLGWTAPTTTLVRRALDPIYPDGKVPGPSAALGAGSTVTKAAKELRQAVVEDGLTPRELIELQGWPPEAVERVQHLVAPPTCNACEYRMVLRGSHYCAFKECFEAKRDAYKARELEKVRRKPKLSALPIYARGDGKAVAAPGGFSYYDKDASKVIEAAFGQALKDKHPDLRLRPCAPGLYADKHWATDSKYAEVVAVGQLAAGIEEGMKREHQASRQPGRLTDGDYEAERHARDRNQAVDERLVDEASRHFGVLFGGLKGAMLRTVVALALRGPMPWYKAGPDDDDEGDYFQDGYGNPILQDEDGNDRPPEQHEGLLREALVKAVLHEMIGTWYADPHEAAARISAQAVPDGCYAADGLRIDLPAEWASEILGAYDRGETPEPEPEVAEGEGLEEEAE